MKRKTKFPFNLVIAFLIVLLIFYLSCKNIKEGITDPPPPPTAKNQQVGNQPSPITSPQPNPMTYNNPMTNNNADIGPMSVAPPPKSSGSTIKLSLKNFLVMVPGPEEKIPKGKAPRVPVQQGDPPPGYAINMGQVALIGNVSPMNGIGPNSPPLPDIDLVDASRLIGGRLVFSLGGKDQVNTITAVWKGRSVNEYIVNYKGDSQGLWGGQGIRGTISTSDNCGCS